MGMGGKRSAGLWALLVPIALSAALPLAAVAQQATAPTATGPAKTIIVLDGSRDMWGKIGGQSKVPLFRAAIAQTFTAYKDKVALGLVAFGHGSASGCGDIEVRAKPGEFTKAAQNKVLLNFRPQKSKPIGAALTEAGPAGPAGEKLDLVLVTDGADNCKIDVCATAKAIKQAAPNLRMHVLGFDPKPDKGLKALACVAEATGGTFEIASNASELKAKLAEIFDAAAGPVPATAPAPVAAASPQPTPPAAAASPVPTPAPAATPPAAAAANAPASDGDGGDDADGGDDSDVAQAPDAAQGADTAQPAPPPSGTAPAPAGPQGAGETAMQKSVGPASAQTYAYNPAAAAAATQQAAPAAPSMPVPVTFKALLTEAGPKVDTGVIWRVFALRPGPDGARKLLSTHREAMPTEALLPGDYLVNAAYGLSNLTKEIKVQTGRSLEETFILNCGGLKLGAILISGAALPEANVHFDILSDEEDQFGNRREILGDAKPGVIIRLNAGAYHIVSTYGHTNATVRVDVTVEPGKITEATVKHAAAPVTFKLVQSAGGEAQADTKWTVLTMTGDVVKETAGALPTHILAAGDYAVVASHNGLSYTTKFNVASGQAKQIEVVMEQGPSTAEELQAIRNPPPAPPAETLGAAGAGGVGGSPDGSGMAFGGGATPPPPGGLINPGVLLRPRLP
jgi:hypothetical protein